MKDLRIAIFPGSFDPFTNGHHDILMRAIHLFDKIIIAFGENSQKQRIFPVDDLINKLAVVYEKYPNVSIKKYKGLTVDFAAQVQAKYIIRGLRSGADFDYEKPIATINSDLNTEIETIFFISKPENEYLSSSIVRELYKHKRNISKYVPFML